MQNTIFLDDAILRSAGQLSVLIERVVAGFLQTMRPGNVVHTIVHDLTAAADIVEITVNFNQANIGYLAVDIVTKHAVIVLHDAILVRSTRNELALCVKGIGSFLHQTVHSGAVVGLVHDQLALAVGIVVIVTDLDHTCRSLDAVDIVEEIFASLQDSVLAGVLVVQNDTVLIEVVAPFRKRKAIGLVEPAILAVQHSALHRRREGQALTLLQILLNREVIIVDLAVLLDNALQAGFFFDDAAVEPIGVRSDAVNTGNVALEYAFRIKDAAGFFRCSIGDQCRDSGSRISGFGVQIVGIAVNDGPTGLLQFAVLVVLSALLALKPAGRARDHFAFCDKLITNRAIRIAGVTGCCKRCFDRIANLRVVTGSRDHFLFNNNFVANRAMLAFRQARLGAGRSLCCVNDLGMSLGGDHFLRNKDFVADGAVLALGQTSLRAGRSLCCIDYFCVAGRRDFFHTGEDCLTNGALRTGFMASLGAGSGLFRNFNRGMPGCVDCFGLGCIANCAGVGLDTGVLTGRGGRDLALIPSVALGGNLFLRFDNRSADRAVRAFGLAGCGAGSCNSFVDDLGMSLGENSRAGAYFLAAILAVGVAGVAILGAGCVLRVADFGIFMIAGLGSSPHTV